MFRISLKITVLWVIATVVTVLSKQEIQNYWLTFRANSEPNFNYSTWQSGDLIFRRGSSPLSRLVDSADEAAEFSHVGMVRIVGKQPMVIHASTGQPWGKDAVVKVETLAAFLSQEKVTSFAIYRLQYFSKERGEQAAEVAYNYAQQKLPFDQEFSLETTDRLYCTELIWRSYLEVGVDLVDSDFTELNLPFAQGEYILPSDLLLSRHVERVNE